MSDRESMLKLEQVISQAVLGQDTIVRQVIMGLLADGHVLLESLPGLAKTRTVKALARHTTAEMSRIQFTPDLLPSDITGAEVLKQHAGGNEIVPAGAALFGNLILADEINRAPAKVQAALLEAMEERQITVAGTSHPMPALYMVLATQNPIEQEGTYVLPEAQMDRFLMKIVLDYPDAASEVRVLSLLRQEAQSVAEEDDYRISQEALFDCRRAIASIHVSELIDRYVVDLANATRRPVSYDKDLARWIDVGSSPRGAIAMDRVARTHAFLVGADFVSPDDVRAIIHPVLRHRLHLSYDAMADGVTADQVIDRLIDVVAVPV